MPLSSLLCDGRRRAGGVKWDAGPHSQGRKKSAERPQKPWSLPVANDRHSEGLSLLLHISNVHIQTQTCKLLLCLQWTLFNSTVCLISANGLFHRPAAASTDEGNAGRLLKGATAVRHISSLPGEMISVSLSMIQTEPFGYFGELT